MRTWSKHLVLRAILKRHADGRPINSRAVFEEDHGLWNAARRRFGNWTGALRAAGYDLRAIRRHHVWTDARIIRAIVRQAEAGAPMNAAALRRRDSRLLYSAKRRFGGWARALAAAGLDPDDHRKARRPWTPEAVLEAIRARVDRAEPVNAGSVGVGSLYQAVQRFFGSWRQALEAAGLDTFAICRTLGGDLDIPRRIRDLAREGHPLNHNAMLATDRRLLRAACLQYGSWPEALAAAGYDVNEIRKTPKWTRQKIVEVILKRRSEGLPLNYSQVRWVLSMEAVKRLFGSWDRALHAAGIAPDPTEAHRRWSRQAVIEAIGRRQAQGLPLNAKAVRLTDAPLANAYKRWFGAWSEALEAAGIDPHTWRMTSPRWTRSRLIETIRRIARQNGPLNPAAPGRRYLVRAAGKLFGSWDAALQAAGVDPRLVRLHHAPWTAQSLIEEIRRKHRAGEPLNAGDVRPGGLRTAARRFYGTWDEALTAAGLDPRTIRKNRRHG